MKLILGNSFLLSFAALRVSAQTEGPILGQPATDPCTVCAQAGESPVLEPTVAFFTGASPLTCPEIVAAVAGSGTLQGDETCKDYQLMAFQIGCCQSPPYEYCSVCPDGSPFQEDNTVPVSLPNGAVGIGCAENQYRLASLNGVTEPGKCEDTVIQRGAHYCGCPNEEQECYVCPDGRRPTNPERGDAWVLNTNCEGIEFLFSLYKSDECSNFREIFGVDFAHFCKCPDYEQENDAGSCVICEEGLANPDFQYTSVAENGRFDRTCAQAAAFAESIIRQDICESEMNQVIALGCQCRNNKGPVFTAGASGNNNSGAVATSRRSELVSSVLATVVVMNAWIG